MKYRIKGFYDRYNYDHLDTYDSGDRDVMQAYMKKRIYSPAQTTPRCPLVR